MLFGLIGKSLKHSYSKRLFDEHFRGMHTYQLFELDEIGLFSHLILQHPNLCGVNVTIPYKSEIVQFLHHIDNVALQVGAVNTVSIDNGQLKGFNTDVVGFERAYESVLKSKQSMALILGTGGASKAVAYVLKKNNIPFLFVSRTKKDLNTIIYDEVDNLAPTISLIINTTPAGMYPSIDEMPPLSFKMFKSKPIVIDLIYNPEKTVLLKVAEQEGCDIYNGMEMLKQQAIESWKIWGIY